MSEADTNLWWALAIIDSAVGGGFFIFGIRQREPLPLICGIALSVLPMLAGTGLGELGITVGIAIGYAIARTYI